MPEKAPSTSTISAGTPDTVDIRANVLETLGHTPLVRLNAITRGIRTAVVGKLEEAATPAVRLKTGSASG